MRQCSNRCLGCCLTDACEVMGYGNFPNLMVVISMDRPLLVLRVFDADTSWVLRLLTFTQALVTLLHFPLLLLLAYGQDRNWNFSGEQVPLDLVWWIVIQLMSPSLPGTPRLMVCNTHGCPLFYSS